MNIHKYRSFFLSYVVEASLLIFIVGCQSTSERVDQDSKPYLPATDLGELFVAVQTSGVFNDYKTFVDCSPNADPGQIVALYQAKKKENTFDLKDFVLENFTLPPPIEKKELDRNEEMINHLKNHWKYLTRTSVAKEEYTSLIGLLHPYVIPGGRFREMFYWDSYFTMIGLLESDEDRLALGILKNFGFLIDTYGFIPNGNRTYFLSRSQPPFFAEMLVLFGKKNGVAGTIQFLPQLEKEYQFWTKNDQDVSTDQAISGRSVSVDGVVLNRYIGSLTSPRSEAYGKELSWAKSVPESERAGFHQNLRAACESGWDFSSRWFEDGKTKATIQCENIIPICLNSLLYNLEHQLSILHAFNGDAVKSNQYQVKANKRKQDVTELLWSEEDGFFRDFDIKRKASSPILSLATLYPLYFGLATEEQAAKVAKVVAEQLLFDGGVVTTLVETGEQWDYPNGWAPLQWITVMGLAKYGHTELAISIAQRWLNLNDLVYQAEGKMMEKYNVVNINLPGGGGEYENQDGFGWTNGVALGLDTFLKEQSEN